MKINKLGSSTLVNMYKMANTKNISSCNNAEKKDLVEISEKGKIMSYLSGNEIKIPKEIDVEKIKKMIQDGNYKVDSEKLADKILESIHGEEI